ncbi:MAG: hypothetical protein L6N95_04505 [Candidatus Methylarchaceae archaeon HK01B]|nr:hypothetical protein [Candidatus Methylarchaceae archaeon HK01M]MCP8312448.1 hypothetical protein [Candidatus Methylarchaceae archaeon HK02M1]MCP8319071.1 hypothetical protein [Candidatus Methylarchaceae archaeon HK01B]
MSQIRRFVGAIAVIFFIVFLLPLILPIAFFVSAPAPLPPFTESIFALFWGYRFYDTIFLAFAIFASILGLSSLFRAESPKVHAEESITEGYVEEEFEEEE